MFRPMQVEKVVFGNGEGQLWQRDSAAEASWEPFAGRVQAVYLDPPYLTGDRMERRRPLGEEGWRTGKPLLTSEGYLDRYENREEYLATLRGLLLSTRELLTETGVVMLHLDWHTAAWGRILLDELFGEDCFMNEVIWAYESGGRAKRCFSRKHDNILLYGRTPHWRFDPARAASQRRDNRRNHLRRGVDESGRGYGAIVVRGKEYRYYDDELVAPGDVWTDISHLQQRDPERTGWPTQKPQRLLNRLLRCALRPGETAADLCCGSGTALAAARTLNCRVLGCDLSEEALNGTAARLGFRDVTIQLRGHASQSRLSGQRLENGVIFLTGFRAEEIGGIAESPMDDLEAWASGSVREGTFYARETFQRSKKNPALPLMSLTAAGEGIPAVWTMDAAGRSVVFGWTEEPDDAQP